MIGGKIMRLIIFILFLYSFFLFSYNSRFLEISFRNYLKIYDKFLVSKYVLTQTTVIIKI